MKSLYVTDRLQAGDGRFAAILAALRGAPDLSVQLREKQATDRECLAWARKARESLGNAVALYVNRRLDIALEAQADGVHLPAAGLPVGRVKAGTPRGFRVGVSTHSAAEAARAVEEGADLVLLGPVFDTPSKRAYGPALGAGALADLPPLAAHAAEVYAIGGISAENLTLLDPYRDRLTGVAGIRLFQEAADPFAAAQMIAAR